MMWKLHLHRLVADFTVVSDLRTVDCAMFLLASKK